MSLRKKSDAGMLDVSLCEEWTSHITVCSRLSIVGTTKYMNDRYWTRTNGKWRVKERDFPDGSLNPHSCPVYRGRRHVLYYC